MDSMAKDKEIITDKEIKENLTPEQKKDFDEEIHKQVNTEVENRSTKPIEPLSTK